MASVWASIVSAATVRATIVRAASRSIVGTFVVTISEHLPHLPRAMEHRFAAVRVGAVRYGAGDECATIVPSMKDGVVRGIKKTSAFEASHICRGTVSRLGISGAFGLGVVVESG